MKALVKKSPEVGIWMEDVPMPKMGDRDVLIQVHKTSICGTDMHLYKWDAWAQKHLPVPSIIGHEFVGHIVERGKDVRGFQVGDRVSAEGHLTCGTCRECRNGRRVLCPNTVGLGYDQDGAFAEFVAIPQENLFKVPSEISDEVACLYDPLGNTVHAALSFLLVGKDVLITGAGPIGLMAIRVAFQAGARRVVITDINPTRLKMAEQMGASAAINVQTDSLQPTMKRLGIEEGFDTCLEMSGSPAAFASLPDLLTTGGEIALLGILPAEAHLDWHKVIFKMFTIKGICGRKIFDTWDQATHMLQSGLDISPIITHRYPAHEFQKGFDAMLSGESGKVVLDWTS